ncbi:hypothetical protein HK096_009369 [Nowakowskiella sp. JEL0078]|nr:hypothetical protein HK096_009369 [Nowakowskiella sp. JEL0078]
MEHPERDKLFSDFLAKKGLLESDTLEQAEEFLSEMVEAISSSAEKSLDALRAECDTLRFDVADKDTKLKKLIEKILLSETRAMFVAGPKDNDDQALKQALNGWPDHMSAYKYDIYISYSPENDAAIANQIYLLLQLYPNLNMRMENQVVEKHKGMVFLDEQELAEGETWEYAYKYALKNSKLIVMLVSNDTVESFKRSNLWKDHVLIEWETALIASDKGKCAVLPVFMADSSGKAFDFAKIDSDLSSDLYPLDRFETDNDIQNYTSAATILKKLIKTQGISLMNHLQLKTILPRISGKYDDFIEIDRESLEKAQNAFNLLTTVETDWESSSCKLEMNSSNDFKRFCIKVLPYNSFWTEVEFIGMTVTMKDLQQLKEAVDFARIRQSWRVSTWKFTDCPFRFSSSDGSHVVELLEKFESINLKALHLANNDIGPNEIAVLLDGFKNNTVLQSLSLEANLILEQGIEYICKSLRSNIHLTSLNLINIDVEIGLQLLVEALKGNTTLKHFTLERTEIGNVGAGEFSVVIQENKVLKSLRLASIEMQHEGVKFISNALKKNNTLEVIDISDNNLYDQGAQNFIDALDGNTTLKNICLANCEIYSGGFKSIFEALCENESIEEIDLSQNYLHEGIGFPELVLKNKTLRKILLKHCVISDTFAKSTFEALEKNKTIIELDLSENSIGEDGFTAVGNSLLENSTLLKLDLSENGSIGSSVQALVAGLNKNSELLKLSLAGCYMTPDDAEELANVIIQKDQMSLIETFLASTSRSSYPLHKAAELGYAPVIDALLEKNFKIDVENEEGYQPLHTAVQNGQEDVVSMLIDRDADIEAKTKDGNYPIHIAIQNWSIDMVNLLLNKEVNVNSVNEDGNEPLLEALKYIVNNNKVEDQTDIEFEDDEDEDEDDENEDDEDSENNENKEDEEDNVDNENKEENEENEDNENEENDSEDDNSDEEISEIIKSLIDFGADIDVRDHKELSPLHIAVESYSPVLVSFLIEKEADLESEDSKRQKPLHLAVELNAIRVIEVLCKKGANINAEDQQRYTPLCIAVQNGHLKVVKYLLKMGANVNVVTASNQTPLSIATEYGHCDIMELLLENGADVDGSFSRPLIKGAEMGNIDAINILHKANCNLEAVDFEGYTALHIVADTELTEVLEILLNLGCNVNAVSNDGSTPLFCLLAKNAQLLIDHGADLTIRNNSGETALIYALKEAGFDTAKVLIEAGAELNFVTDEDDTPLNLAVDDLETVKLLLKTGADVNLGNKHGTTPLLNCAEQGTTELFAVLINAGADCNILDEDGDGILHCAVMNSLEMVKAVCEKTVKIFANKNGATQLDYAKEGGHLQIFEYLKNLG